MPRSRVDPKSWKPRTELYLTDGSVYVRVSFTEGTRAASPAAGGSNAGL